MARCERAATGANTRATTAVAGKLATIPVSPAITPTIATTAPYTPASITVTDAKTSARLIVARMSRNSPRKIAVATAAGTGRKSSAMTH